jgi:cell shape-determining protein MreC
VTALQAAVAAVRERVSGWQRKVSSRSELQAKEQALAPIVNDLWEQQAKK